MKTYYKIKTGEIDEERVVTISYKDRRITKGLILGLERFFEHWDNLAEWERNNSSRRRFKK